MQDEFMKKELINKGWSGDKKYYVETFDNQKCLLRISDISQYERKLTEYKMLEKASVLDVNIPKPIDFRISDEKKVIYSLMTWVVGDEVDSFILSCSNDTQYNIGEKAGKLLKKIHGLPAPNDIESWEQRFIKMVDESIDFYNTKLIKTTKADLIVNYLQNNKHLLKTREQTFNHGDYNTTNLIYTVDGEVGAIDFSASDLGYGDPWWEFCSTPWGKEPMSNYLTGVFNGYFQGEPPKEFFQLHAYYLAHEAIVSLCSTFSGFGGEISEGEKHLENILSWYDNFNTIIPSWYVRVKK